MNFAGIIHEPKSKMSYSYDDTTIHVRIKIPKGEAQRVVVRAVDPFNWFPSEDNPQKYVFHTDTIQEIEMVREQETEYHDVWFASIQGFTWSRIRYAFVIEQGESKYLYGSHYSVDLDNNSKEKDNVWNFFNFPYINPEDIYQAPKWVEDTVWYQIFPHSFSWDGKPCTKENHGTLKGVVEKLDYIKELGCNGIYFTPLFVADSNHKYDTTDYFQIDPEFGTNEVFKVLVEEAHKRGIKVMLDAVFNHCGDSHPFWQDVKKKGKESEYYDCFYIMDSQKEPSDMIEIEGKKFNNYKMFGYVGNMPKWNTSNEKVRKHLLEAACYWIEKYHIDGWRLDVANEVSHDFWRTFRKKVKELNPELYILGENWDNAMPWLGGDQFDAVMNYEFMNQIWNFIGIGEEGKDKKKSSTPSQFKNGMSDLMTCYPKPVEKVMFNLLESHDTARIATVCNGTIEAVKLAYVIQMTFSGSPSIYYGGELGMLGKEDDNRRNMIWEDTKQDNILKKHVQKLIEIRRNHLCCKSTHLEWILADDRSHIVIYKKSHRNSNLYVVLHNSNKDAEIILPVELQGKVWRDIYNKCNIIFEEKLSMEAYKFLILEEN